MYHDGRQYDKTRFIALAWNQRLRESLPKIVREISDQFGVEAEYEYLSLGSFNCCYRLKGLHSVVRFPIFGKSVFRYEKTNDECVVMAYVSRYTSIPVPKLLMAKSCDMGPYMVMSYVGGTRLSDHLKAQAGPGVPIVLEPDINTTILAQAYRNMAKVLIELSRCELPRIGAVAHDELGGWGVKKKPVTLNMNQIVSCGNYPPYELPQQSFVTANDYFTALAETHITHLRTQRNDAVDDDADCRKKYVARYLFLKIARNFSTAYNNGPFPLYCDDFRPTNVIVDPDLNIRSVIDWEYCYAAPAEFTYCSPWWLLLKHPDDWDNLRLFFEEYVPRHKVFIQALRDEENEMIRRGDMSENQRLSNGMVQSLENGHFWFCLAATSSYGFDDIYWDFVDPLYYGEFTSIEDRIGLLSKQEQEMIEPFVQLKMKQAEEDELDEHWDYHQKFTA